MPLLKTIVLVCLLGLGTGLSAQTITAHGVRVEGSRTQVRLVNTTSGQAAWMTVGETFGGYTVQSYDSRSDAVILSRNGSQLRLPLPVPKLKRANAPATPVVPVPTAAPGPVPPPLPVNPPAAIPAETTAAAPAAPATSSGPGAPSGDGPAPTGQPAAAGNAAAAANPAPATNADSNAAQPAAAPAAAGAAP